MSQGADPIRTGLGGGSYIGMVAVSGAAKVIRRDDELLCRPIARALLAQTRPDAAAHRKAVDRVACLQCAVLSLY